MQRTASDYRDVATSLDTTDSNRALRSVTTPTTIKGTVRKVGIALAIAPEPFTTVAGVALVAASFAMGGREPASLGTLREEARLQFAELATFSDDLLSLTL